ncbi:class I SAM-dependent methyltransferase [Anaplasma phagocytophilum]|uniref:class I SAM-dependent methyltransferase n=1 Tax=Anaplasma phagocytophilum TaxID=948 RepID=UPI0020101D16|nr:methyltransferase domain-containing protein [Anaplasma phagocytophilum]UQD54605.1 methyltransferase domain-containing protein [Anaplasma phagocytophilum]
MLFDRKIIRQCRASALSFSSLIFLEVAALLAGRVAFLQLERVSDILFLGCRGDPILGQFVPFFSLDHRVFLCDAVNSQLEDGRRYYRVVSDDEAMPFLEQSFDLVISYLTLHNLNSLVEAISRINSILGKGGVFIAAAFGESTLRGIKKAIISAEGGCVVPRIQPFPRSSDMAMLLQTCGFMDIVVDVSVICISYESLHHLYKDLKDMGEGDMVNKGSEPLEPAIMERAWHLYRRALAGKGEGEDTLPVEYEIIFLKGRKK